MTQKENGRPGEYRATTENNSNIETNHSMDTSNTGAPLQENDPLLGWYSLGAGVKPSRERNMKKAWVRKGGR